MSLNVLTWNVEWAGPRSRHATEIRDRISAHTPEIVCLTEANIALLTGPGHTIFSQPDSGYKVNPKRRKVLLWSREPWDEVDATGIDSLPPGRFIAGVTQTSLGKVKVVGVCIPWFGSRTEARRGNEQRKQWQDHEDYLAGLTEYLRHSSAKRQIVMGDFNQIIGLGSRAPDTLQSKLQTAFPPAMRIATSEISYQERKTIDHIAVSDDWAVESMDVISNIHDGKCLSDHFGIAANLSLCNL